MMEFIEKPNPLEIVMTKSDAFALLLAQIEEAPRGVIAVRQFFNSAIYEVRRSKCAREEELLIVFGNDMIGFEINPDAKLILGNTEALAAAREVFGSAKQYSIGRGFSAFAVKASDF